MVIRDGVACVKLHRNMSRTVGSRRYYKHTINLPARFVEKMGWHAADELLCMPYDDGLLIQKRTPQFHEMMPSPASSPPEEANIPRVAKRFRQPIHKRRATVSIEALEFDWMESQRQISLERYQGLRRLCDAVEEKMQTLPPIFAQDAATHGDQRRSIGKARSRPPATRKNQELRKKAHEILGNILGDPAWKQRGLPGQGTRLRSAILAAHEITTRGEVDGIRRTLGPVWRRLHLAREATLNARAISRSAWISQALAVYRDRITRVAKPGSGHLLAPENAE